MPKRKKADRSVEEMLQAGAFLIWNAANVTFVVASAEALLGSPQEGLLKAVGTCKTMIIADPVLCHSKMPLVAKNFADLRNGTDTLTSHLGKAFVKPNSGLWSQEIDSAMMNAFTTGIFKNMRHSSFILPCHDPEALATAIYTSLDPPDEPTVGDPHCERKLLQQQLIHSVLWLRSIATDTEPVLLVGHKNLKLAAVFAAAYSLAFQNHLSFDNMNSKEKTNLAVAIRSQLESLHGFPSDRSLNLEAMDLLPNVLSAIRSNKQAPSPMGTLVNPSPFAHPPQAFSPHSLHGPSSISSNVFSPKSQTLVPESRPSPRRSLRNTPAASPSPQIHPTYDHFEYRPESEASSVPLSFETLQATLESLHSSLQETPVRSIRQSSCQPSRQPVVPPKIAPKFTEKPQTMDQADLNHQLNIATLNARFLDLESVVVRIAQENGIRFSSRMPVGLEDRFSSIERTLQLLLQSDKNRTKELAELKKNQEVILTKLAEQDNLKTMVGKHAEMVEALPQFQHLVLALQNSQARHSALFDLQQTTLQALGVHVGVDLPGNASLQLVDQAMAGPVRRIRSPSRKSPPHTPSRDYLLRSRSEVSPGQSPNHDLSVLLNLQ
jgi:hypothetical protein